MVQDTGRYRDGFLSEARDRVSSMNTALLALEKDPARMELVNDIFREVHTLKSMAATMQYDSLARLCHTLEDALDAIRKNRLESTSCIDLMFECFDSLQSTLIQIKEGKDDLDTEDLVRRLQLAASSNALEREPDGDAPMPLHPAPQAAPAVEKVESIEVAVEKLDLLMNLTEELLINRMQFDKIREEVRNPELSAAIDTLARLASELQYSVMQSRLVPMGFVFDRFPRMIRDLAKKQGKEIALDIRGADVQLDRTVIDAIGDALVHLLRNAIDHGLESTEARKQTQKPPKGTIRLAASRTKGSVVIVVADDGAGMDLQAIRNVAVRQGNVAPSATQDEVLSSIFSGISTSDRPTEVSGRGLGLNIVKRKIESLGGSVSVESQAGAGATFTIDVPLTLAVIGALLIKIGGRTYAIPLANVDRLVTVNKANIRGFLRHEAIVLNGKDIMVTRLDALFGVPMEDIDNQPIVIARKGRVSLGLAVDSFVGTQEIVIKPLNRMVGESRYFAGSTIIGTGEVVLILDVANLVLSRTAKSRVALTERNAAAGAEPAALAYGVSGAKERQNKHG